MLTHTVMLPSKGKLNDFDGNVQFCEMGLDVEKEMLTNRTPTEKIINVVQSCVENPSNLQVGDLPLVDVMFLLFHMRAISLDKDYPIPVQCNFCDFSFRHTVTIPDDFEVVYAPDDLEEPAELELPSSGTKLSVKFLRGSDQLEIERKARTLLQGKAKGFRPGHFPQNQDVSLRNLIHILRISRQIVAINGENATDAQAQAFIENKQRMTMRDSNVLKDYFENESFGMDTDVEVQCPSCGMDDFYTVPIRPEFFRPNRRDQRNRRNS